MQISDIITAVGTAWDTSIIAKPTMANGKPGSISIAANVNYILFYDDGRPFDPADPTTLEEQILNLRCKCYGTTPANMMLILRALRKAMLSITITNGFCYTDRIDDPYERTTQSDAEIGFIIRQLLAAGDAL